MVDLRKEVMKMSDPKIEFESDSNNFLGNVDQTRQNSMVPPPPKPGEYMICQICGEKILPEQMSTDEKTQKYEFKWHVHYSCTQYAFQTLDYNTKDIRISRKIEPPQWK